MQLPVKGIQKILKWWKLHISYEDDWSLGHLSDVPLDVQEIVVDCFVWIRCSAFLPYLCGEPT